LPIAFADLRNLRFSSGGVVLRTINRTPASTAEIAGRAMASPDEADFVIWLTLPVSSSRLSHAPSRETSEAVARANASILAFLLHEVDVDAMPRPADETLTAALAPLRCKLDLLTDLVARLCYRDIVLPPVSQLELGPTHVAWQSSQEWRRGDWLRLDLYFHQVFREPVSLLAAAATDCAAQGLEAGCRIEAELCEMPGSTRERLARLAFLTRRQQLARQRPRATAVGK
jgi:hypothetical protein